MCSTVNFILHRTNTAINLFLANQFVPRLLPTERLLHSLLHRHRSVKNVLLILIAHAHFFVVFARGGTPLYGLNGDVRPARVCFSGFLS